MRIPLPLSRLIGELKRLPGIGEKNAQRLAFYLLGAPRERAESLSRALMEMKDGIRTCSHCFNLSEGDLCSICLDPGRSRRSLCVVESARDLIAIENTGQYHGMYHVLMGILSPMKGIGPADLKIGELVDRISEEEIREVILATNLDVEGESTASYLINTIKPLGVEVTRIARGIPIGGNLENADQITLGMALDGRNKV
ncbi:MAG TPA: recombination protein RecR [Proteobacteria bacterium]|nr:recombination protein RecR [bacterium BMS3Abin14]HDL52787.1 recombination protein RecR [Pseudomonadota bacterium]